MQKFESKNIITVLHRTSISESVSQIVYESFIPRYMTQLVIYVNYHQLLIYVFIFHWKIFAPQNKFTQYSRSDFKFKV